MSDKPRHQRPELPDFWDHRFSRGVTPWDIGQVPSRFARFIAETPEPLATLIPGCGAAHEAGLLANCGWPVQAIDFSFEAVTTAKALLGPAADCVHQADFFSWRPTRPLDLVYERAFLCALPPALRSDYGHQMAALLPAGGLLAGYFFFGDTPYGPPFRISREALDTLLCPAFDLLTDEASPDQRNVFESGSERWMVWVRRP